MGGTTVNVFKASAIIALSSIIRISIIGLFVGIILLDIPILGTIAYIVSLLILAHTALLVVITQGTPVNFAVNTPNETIMRHMWKPNKISIYAACIAFLLLSSVLIGYGFYLYGLLFFAYGGVHFIWPVYIKKINEEKQILLMKVLQETN